MGFVLSSAAVDTGSTRPLVALWKRHDRVRDEQFARLDSLDLQASIKYGKRAWDEAMLQWRQLPAGVRVDLPGPHVFAAVLGVFRTGATIKDNKLLALELSAAELAELIDYGKSTVEAALRWLGCEAIEVGGVKVARGLGIIHRCRRTGIGLLRGVRKFIYRTSRIVLTEVGRLLLGLGLRPEERKLERAQARSVARPLTVPVAAPSPPPSTAGPPRVIDDDEVSNPDIVAIARREIHALFRR